jgi:hypothetical protein
MDTNIEKAKKIAAVLSCLLRENDIYCESCADADTCSLLGQAMVSVKTN